MGAISAQMLSLFAREGSRQPSWSRPARANTSAELFFFAKPGGIAGWIEGKCEAAKKKTQDRWSLNRWRRIITRKSGNLTVKFHESDWNIKLKRLRIAKCCSLFKCSFSGFMTCSFQICFSFPSRILCSLPSSSSSLEEGLWFLNLSLSKKNTCWLCW